MTPSSAIGVVGAGGHGKVVIATLKAAGCCVAAMFDHDQRLWGSKILGVEVVGPPAELERLGVRRALLAVGDNRARRELVQELAELELDWPTVVHPSAVVHESVHFDAGTIVFAGAVVQPDTRLGSHCIVNTGASVDHDCALGDFVHVAPGAHLAGGVKVGDGALIGIGSAVIPGVEIGEWAIVGAKAAVVRDTAAGTTVTGVPAR